MTPLDFRNATWEVIKSQLMGRRLAVYSELARLGPCTTRELAARSGMEILAVRPRITELIQLGFAEMLPPADPEHPGKEGIYLAVPEADAVQAFLARQASTATGQLPLKLYA